jgi:hypothetical protein
MPCLDAGGNTTLLFTAETSDNALCAATPRKSSVIFSGALCGTKGSTAIQWLSAHTVDPRPGLKPADCAWEFPPGSRYTGFCGSCVHDPGDPELRLPTHVC